MDFKSVQLFSVQARGTAGCYKRERCQHCPIRTVLVQKEENPRRGGSSEAREGQSGSAAQTAGKPHQHWLHSLLIRRLNKQKGVETMSDKSKDRVLPKECGGPIWKGVNKNRGAQVRWQ